MSPIVAKRLHELDSIVLQRGSHASPKAGMCAMELAAYLAGQPHSDHPVCVSPVLGAFLRRWNDDLDDAGRQRLKPYIPRVLGTAGDAATDERRAWLVTDWLVRVHTPAWLELGGMKDQADALRVLPVIDSTAACVLVQPTLDGARKRSAAARDAAGVAAWDAAGVAAWDAARDAAWDAARDAAWDAARDAARDAAWDAAGVAAGDAAGDAARDAAWVAAWDAAWDAADALKPTALSLQESAFHLLDQLITAGSSQELR